jgi:hypothetical protein
MSTRQSTGRPYSRRPTCFLAKCRGDHRRRQWPVGEDRFSCRCGPVFQEMTLAPEALSIPHALAMRGRHWLPQTPGGGLAGIYHQINGRNSRILRGNVWPEPSTIVVECP